VRERGLYQNRSVGNKPGWRDSLEQPVDFAYHGLGEVVSWNTQEFEYSAWYERGEYLRRFNYPETFRHEKVGHQLLVYHGNMLGMTISEDRKERLFRECQHQSFCGYFAYFFKRCVWKRQMLEYFAAQDNGHAPCPEGALLQVTFDIIDTLVAVCESERKSVEIAANIATLRAFISKVSCIETLSATKIKQHRFFVSAEF
jgi:hypothetical protein